MMTLPDVVQNTANVAGGRRASISTENLTRHYKVKADKKKGQAAKTLVALDNVSLEVYEGELFGLLGPNGAGKTTLIKILTTLLAPTGGVAYVDGLDVVKQANTVRQRINMVSGGETSGYGVLKVRENLWMFSQFYGVTWKDANARIEEMLKIVELEDKANALVSTLSTGQRQRMNFCRGFITDPKVIFLDEPTLGLDVHAARIVRDFTKGWLQKHPDRTLLLTTHYMAEADELCDRIAIIDHGKVLACDTPSNLKRMLQSQPIFEIGVSGITERTIPILGEAPGVEHVTGEPDASGSTYKLKFILRDESAISSVVQALTSQEASILNLQKHEPTLEDVFIKLVGRSLTDEDKNGK
ncbi:MAG: ABC transporter ATP-binding protein [Chloroflexota bacterium]|nr:ABC transporter ATP-binding protein [Chloroflexota bacterium]MDQ5864146.1 ABC transporter ATP-binding protein [Chloroflexota bacterium]